MHNGGMIMNGFEDILADVAKKAETANPQREGDYIGANGLLYCGKCRTPKQHKVDKKYEKMFPQGQSVVWCSCWCETERYETEKKQLELERERQRLMFTAPINRNNCFSDDFYKRMSFSTDKGKAPKAIEAAHRYVDNFDKFSAENMGLMFLGNVGTGKTFAACCIANALIDKGYKALVATASDLIRAACDFKTSAETFSRIREIDLLIIDDFGAQSNTENNTSALFDVVDTRYKSAKPLVITSNLTVADMKNAPDVKLKRIYDRINEACTCPFSPVVLNGKSLRDEIAREKHNSSKESETP